MVDATRQGALQGGIGNTAGVAQIIGPLVATQSPAFGAGRGFDGGRVPRRLDVDRGGDAYHRAAGSPCSRDRRHQQFGDREMIELYYWPTPNGHKITLFLEEAGLDYTIHPVNIGKGDQFAPAFLAFSPNNRMPAIIDRAPADGGEGLSVFESGAILLYLAEKTGRFGGGDLRGRTTVTEWLMWQMGGLGPMLGQNHHFNRYAPEKILYAIDRYVNETNRLYGVLNRRLEGRDFIVGADYTIADMASYPWILPDHQGQNIDDFPHLRRWHEAVKARPATERAYAKGREIQPAPVEMTDEQKKVLFGQTAR
jgi:GSH-dependent disulfide-bond oxidoreductase